ncbi:hypothetical protein [Erwinia piriflorinigrans]|uniref:Uncharacterized protein n=1 Tax=Erwinia piriflorinigrans CFBP 5888 TaxID=1161919 RepID=V5Z4B1_9GAMM|nr:hypothetical protein [Erwinia piriflorinigrans]CCG86113.1 hypothetical protein EPIR_0748 [Erwinia piriflorinigrans CFBP 5888]
MTLLTIHPSVARDELASKFSAHPAMMLQINRMKNSQVVVLCSFLRGDRLTSAGNNIVADYEVLRLPAIVEILEKKYFIPVAHRNVSTISPTALSATTQTYYVIDESTITRLQSDPDVVCGEHKKCIASKEWVKKQKKIESFIKSNGGLTETVLSLTQHVYKDKMPGKEKLAELEDKFRTLLDELDNAS